MFSFGLVLLLCLERFLPNSLEFFGTVVIRLVFFILGLNFLGFDFIGLIVGNEGFRVYFTTYQL
jgi:hypothetical protein